MSGGRNRKPVELQTKHLTKEEKEYRLKEEKKLKMSSNQLKPPKWLGKVAKKEFKRIVKNLDELDILANVDLYLLAIYCDSYEKYVDATEELKEQGSLTIWHTNKAGERNLVESPYVKIQSKYATTITKIASQFGFSVSARLKMIPPKPEKNDDPFGTIFD